MTTQDNETDLRLPEDCGPLGTDERRRPRRVRIRVAAFLALAAVGTGVSFGVTTLARGSSGAAPVPEMIPSPASGPGAFVEDDDLTAQDNQSNILAGAAQGLVHILSGPTAAGIGLVLTPSGKVLTSAAAVGGTGKLTVKYVGSGMAFSARVIGTDQAAGLALVQLEGGDGRAFSTAPVGNSATIVAGSYDSRQFSFHVAGEVIDTALGTTGTGDNMSLDVGNLIDLSATTTVGRHSQTGLLESALQSMPSGGIGGPLVDLDGQVIGITVAASGSGLRFFSYAMPINTALAVAAKIDAAAGNS
jgi:S1-C subfamily serine protease